MQWTQDDDKRLVEPYRPVADLIESRVEKHPVLQKSLSEGRMVSFSVRDNQFITTVQGRGQIDHAVMMNWVPDLEVQIVCNEDANIEASLTQESRLLLQRIQTEKSLVPENIAIPERGHLSSLLDKFPVSSKPLRGTISRKELAEEFFVTEDTIKIWCTVCSMKVSLTEFNTAQVERLALYKRLVDAGVLAIDIHRIFSSLPEVY